ncbi:S-layer homology domain-containing protein [Lysinibacillus sp. ZYM-1]|uniref:S-layer homology domain-containing protein n=1 Tax=Lysinibacillus sp. ZYM-1 TaxID=1681184 RepID=UPI0018D0148F|nr:S-layer homology domain-containing protein [Lysinibacillus sp. ZYM-1]
MAIVILLLPMLGSFVTFTSPTQVRAATFEGQVMRSYQAITNNTYTGTVTEYTYSLNGVIQKSSTPPTNADWVTPSNYFDSGWFRDSWNEEFTYSNYGEITQTNDAMSIPATATWATINSFQIEGTNQYAIGNTIFQYSVNGVDLQTTTNALNIPTNAMWVALVDFTDGWTKTINHTFTNYTIDRATPVVKSLKISSNSGLSVYAKKGDEVTVSLQTDLPIAAPVLKIAGVMVTALGGGTDWAASLELTDAVNEGDLSVSAVVFSDKGAPSTEITATTDGSSVIYDNTGPNLSHTLAPNEATNRHVTVQVNATDAISGVKLLKWAAGTHAESYFTTDGTAFTNSFTANANGHYTVYARDSVGNEALRSIIVSNIDLVAPSVSLTASTTALTNKDILINATAVDNVAISKQLWAEGLQDSSYFQAGEGTSFTNQFFAARNGEYTVYVEDTAGNFAQSSITVSNLFKQAPKLTLTPFPVKPTNKTVLVDVEVETEGATQGNTLVALRWAKGEQQIAFFASGGGADIVNELEFEAMENGIYSVYARDTAGNETVATITVNTPPVTITGIVLSPKTGQVTVGGTQNFQLVENLSDGTSRDQTANATFTVSDAAIATMQNNELTAIAPGTVTVTATYGSTSDTATITVNATPVTTTGMVLSPKTGQVTVGGKQRFQMTESLSDGTSQDQTANTTFTVSNSTIAKIQGNVLTAIAPGTVTVTGTYGSTSDTATITVNAFPTPTPEPTSEPVYPTEPTPRAINIIRTVEQGIVKYRADVLLDHVQVFVPQLSNQDARTIRLVYPAETATAEAHLNLSRNAGLFLNKQQTNFFMQTALAQLTMPSTSFNGVTEDVFFRIVPVKAQQQEVIQTNALKNEQIQQAMPKRAIISLMGTPVTIETNLQNRPVTITLPISEEVTEEQMASLVVYIEHSDATTEVKRGRIVEFEPGVKGFQFEVDHFSTFSLVYASEAQEEEAEVEVNRLAPYIQGYPDGTFKPNTPVTRAQMATMLARFLSNGDIPTTTNVSFKDTTNHPSKDAIEVVKQADLFNGITETTFNPNGTITRAQMASVVAHWIETVCAQDPSKTICHTSGKGKSFTDVSPTHWAASAIEQVSAWGMMTGNSETTFHPNGSLTRAQAVKVLNQLFERPALEDITTSTFSDVPSTHWAIGEIEAAAIEVKEEIQK